MSEATPNPGDPATPPATPPAAPPPGDPPATPPATPPPSPPAPPSTPPATPPAEPPATPPSPPAANWRDGITDPALKNVAERMASPTDAIKAIVDLRADNSKRIKVPDETSSDEDKAKFRKALGVPDEPTGDKGYKIAPPEGVTLTDGDQALIDTILPVAHQHGVPQAALQGFVGELLKTSHEMEANALKVIKDTQTATEAALKKEWGPDYEPNTNLAKRFVQIHGTDDIKELMNVELPGRGLLGDQPAMMKFLAMLGRRSDEGDLMLGATPDERQSLQAELAELDKAVPVGSAGYTDKAHQAKRTALFDKIYGSAPIVGGQNRAA